MGMRIASMCIRSANFSAPEAAAKAPTPIKSLTPFSAMKALQTLCSTAKKSADQLMSLELASNLTPVGTAGSSREGSGDSFIRSVVGELIVASLGLRSPF